MSIQDPRTAILEKIKAAGTRQEGRPKGSRFKPSPDPLLYLNPITGDLVTEFARNLETVKGHFILCTSRQALAGELAKLCSVKRWALVTGFEPDIIALASEAGVSLTDSLDKTEAALTGCEFLIARTGSVMVSAGQGAGRRIFAHAPVHLVISSSKNLVAELGEALEGIRTRYNRLPSQISLITGPSRTADIEKTLVLGAHGPKELYVFMHNES